LWPLARCYARSMVSTASNLVKPDADFSSGSAHPATQPPIFATHPPPLRPSESPVRLTFVADDGTLRIAQEQEEVGGVEGAYRQGEGGHRHLGRDAHAILVGEEGDAQQ
jgi:hypothetical protein